MNAHPGGSFGHRLHDAVGLAGLVPAILVGAVAGAAGAAWDLARAWWRR